MKNYQKLYYQHYYEMTPKGDHIEVSRRVCFAPPEEPTAENPFKQRWYYSPDKCIAIRLPRDKKGDDAGKANAADLKGLERSEARKFQCVWKDTQNCDQDCDRCNRKVARTLELDKTYVDGDDGLESKYEPADESADIAKILEDEALLATLIALLDRLTQDEQTLWGFLKAGARKQDIANHFHLTLDGVYYREKQLRAKIRADKTLRGFFENN
jgi:hypothetical protein